MFLSQEKKECITKNNYLSGGKFLKNNKMKNILKFILILILVFAISLYSLTYVFLNKLTVGEGAEGYPKPDNTVNVLVFGVAKGLSDSMMLCKLDTKKDEIQIYSIPRDTYFPRKGHNNTAQKKINASYGNGGADEVVKSVSQLTGVPINFYVEVDYNAVKSIVDSIGGIEVEIPNNMNYDDPMDNLHIHFEKGQVVKNGDDIIKLLRWRKNNKGGGYPEGDLGRIKMQQQIVKLGFEKVLNGNVILNIFKLQDPITKNVKTNMTPNQMLYYATKAKDVKVEKINISTIPGTTKTIDGLSFFVAEKKKLSEIFK